MTEQFLAIPASGSPAAPVFFGTPAASGFFAPLLNIPGQFSFSGVIRDGRVASFQLGQLQLGPAEGDSGILDIRLDMRQAATFLGHSYFWLSRHWKRLGVPARRVGKVLFFLKKDLIAFIEGQPAPRRPGRPRTHRGARHA